MQQMFYLRSLWHRSVSTECCALRETANGDDRFRHLIFNDENSSRNFDVESCSLLLVQKIDTVEQCQWAILFLSCWPGQEVPGCRSARR